MIRAALRPRAVRCKSVRRRSSAAGRRATYPMVTKVSISWLMACLEIPMRVTRSRPLSPGSAWAERAHRPDPSLRKIAEPAGVERLGDGGRVAPHGPAKEPAERLRVVRRRQVGSGCARSWEAATSSP